VLSIEEAIKLRQGRRLVFTNGVFDIVHAGHVGYLAEAKALGDMLIVGLNSDSSAKRLGKGADRPINSLEDRAAVVSALRVVDGVVAFNEDTPIRLIEILKPEVHVKGGDYDADTLPESPYVRAYGGEVVILPFLSGRSTTRIIQAIRATET
jgi:rfaE bifunctional protein nucleotidyltransferase chain/domain